MAEREIDPTDPGTGGGGGVPAWLYNPRATPPPADSGYKWLWFTGDGDPRWIHVPTTWTPPATATAPPGDPNAPPPPPGPMTREQRDVLQRGTLGNLEGFMARSSYGNDLKARNSVKNTFATIASRYPSKPSSIDLILADPDFKRLFPNAQKVSADSIDFGGVLSDFEVGTPVGVIDVLTAADPTTDTARGWWWGYNAAGTGPTRFRPQAFAAPGSTPSGSATPESSSRYDWSRYGAGALTRSPEERGWSTLAELGMTGDRANDTPEDIFKRNQAASANDNTAQPWDMTPVTTPKYQPRSYSSPFSWRTFGEFAKGAGLMTAGMMLGPKLLASGNATTLASLAANSGVSRKRS